MGRSVSGADPLVCGGPPGPTAQSLDKASKQEYSH